jgi:hypothetical protein
VAVRLTDERGAGGVIRPRRLATHPLSRSDADACWRCQATSGR